MKKFLSVVGLIIFCGSAAFTAPATYSVSDYLKAVVKNDVNYASLFHDTQSTAGQIKSLYAMYDWRLSAFANYAAQDEVIFGAFQALNNTSTQYGLGVAKKLESTGTLFDAQFSESDNTATYYIPGALAFANYRPNYSLRLTQPLLGDWMGALSRLPLQKMDLQKEISQISESESEENYFENALDLYYDWLLLTYALEPLKESYDNSQELLNVVKQQYNNQFASKGDLLRAQEAVLFYQNALEQTLYQWNRAYAMINQRTGRSLKPAANWDHLPETPELNLKSYQASEPLSGESLRSLQVLQKMIDTVQLEVQENDLKKSPQAAVFGEVAAYKNSTTATDPFSSLSKKDARLGINFSMSLEQSEGVGRAMVLEQKIAQTRESMESLHRKIALIAEDTRLKVQTWQKLLDNAQKIAEYSKERLKLETESYRVGKAPLRDVVDFRNQYVKNKTDALNLQIELSKLQVALASLNDQLLPQIKQQLP